ncbi:alkane 1-monooxygenase [Aliiroseovarius sp. PTFE2010]|uniref:alkane 1-monooxygenase n=1 Tax=Aliiroseovarius sp. PTFE2010 TaxID=3417190 RepID=UPI003CE902A4
MFYRVPLFALASLAMVPLLALGALFGGGWIWAALIYITTLSFLADEFTALPGQAEPETTTAWADRLSVILALSHFALLALGAWAVAGETGLTRPERIAAFFAFGLFLGQVSNANAHELIHRGSRMLHALGKWVYISLLFGHHTSAHPLVHHVHVATAADPNSARMGQSYYAWVPRAWIGSFREGLRAERTRQVRAGRSGWHNPYALYVGGALALILLAAFCGPAVLLAYVGLCGHAQSQLLLSDYVQHYGLRRAMLPSGKPEPVGPRHSWNAPHWFTTLMMLAAPRHSDHHARPSTPYPQLGLPDDAPLLPKSLPAMATLALIPPVWRRVMDPRVARAQTLTGP